MFDKAIAIDPNYALAHAGLADSYSQLYSAFDARDFNLRQAEAASARALELEPDLAEAHLSHGMALSLNKRFDEARLEFERAIALDPRSYEAQYWYGRNELSQGDFGHAIALFERAAAIRPEEYIPSAFRAQALRSLERHEEAMEEHRHTVELVERHLEMHPDDSRALLMGGVSYALLQDHERAAAYAERAMRVDPEDPRVLYNVACTFACSGKTADALDALERSVRSGYGEKSWLEHDSDLESLRKEPRYQALVRAM
jgi:Flp pilus assembly protein TadD